MEAAYHTDRETGWFFTRQEVLAESLPYDVTELQARFASVAADLADPDSEADWRISDTGVRRRVVILVSREGHCLYDLLGRVASGELDVDIGAVIGNHTDLADVTRAHGIPFHHVPFPTSASIASAALAPGAAGRRSGQPGLCGPVTCRARSVGGAGATSQLPAVLHWARPYHQASARGVKLVGATCHYVTAELDAGPIIEQDVIRVDHRDSVADMVRKGRDIEKVVLARGLRWHLEDRVLLYGNRTVIF